MKIEVTSAAPETLSAELVAVPYSGSPSAVVKRLDGRLSKLTESGEAKAEPGSAAVLHTDEGRIALVGIGEGDEDAVRTAAAAATRAAKGFGGSVVWAFDHDIPLSAEAQVRAVVEGALIGAHDPAKWKTTKRSARPERLVIAGAPDGLEAAAARAEVVARWTNHARELVDAPANEITPTGLAEAAAKLLEPLGVTVEALGAKEIESLGLGALAAVGRGGANEPRLIVARYNGAEAGDLLGLVGKSITFDTGGYFLKPQSDIVKQKADMGGGGAVIGALGAIAELKLPINILAVLPAAENMVDGSAYRPSDILTTASGLTVEITNTDAEGRLVLADALWYAQEQGATRLVDVATLTGAMRGALGDMYIGVFSNDEQIWLFAGLRQIAGTQNSHGQCN